MAVARTWAAEWRKRSMSLIWARSSRVLRSSGILVRDPSTLLRMTTHGGRENVGSRMAQALDVAHLGALFQGFTLFRHTSERSFDFAQDDNTWRSRERGQPNGASARCRSSGSA